MAAVYKTKSGDVWDSIAKEVYGSESYTSFLMANNQEHLGHFVFPAGVNLRIEDKPEEASDVTLPDWRS